MSTIASGIPPEQQLRELRARLAEQGAEPADAELGLALLGLKGLTEAVDHFPLHEQQALGVLLVRLAETPALLSGFTQAQTLADAVALAQEQGIAISAEILEALHAAPQELDDAALSQVTGGVIGTITVGLGIAATVVGVLAIANDVEAYLYSDSSSWLGNGIRNAGKAVLGYVP